MDSGDDDFFEKKQSHAAPGITKEKGMHDSKDEVQVVKGTREKKNVVGGKMDVENPMKFDFVIEWDEPKEQVYEAMTSNAKELHLLVVKMRLGSCGPLPFTKLQPYCLVWEEPKTITTSNIFSFNIYNRMIWHRNHHIYITPIESPS